MDDKTRAFSPEALLRQVLDSGADGVGLLNAADVPLDAAFRDMCAANTCGNYGQCWMCPPDVGEIGPMMQTIRTFEKVLVYQTVSPLEDSYDIEGMMLAAERHGALALKLAELFSAQPFSRKLQLGVGGCHLCRRCAKKDGLPCRHPDQAMASLETYGIHVSKLAAACGLKYINGQNTVTYFGALFYCLKSEEGDE